MSFYFRECYPSFSALYFLWFSFNIAPWISLFDSDILAAIVLFFLDDKQSPVPLGRENTIECPDNGDKPDKPLGEEPKSQGENGELQSSDIREPTDRDMDRLLGSDDIPNKSRFLSSSYT